MANDVVAKLLYVAVEDDVENGGRTSFRYTRSALQATLQLMGCKPRHAFKISRRVFELIREEASYNRLFIRKDIHLGDFLKFNPEKNCKAGGSYQITGDGQISSEGNPFGGNIPFEVYKKRTTVFVCRETFLNTVCGVLAEYKYVGPNQRADLILACRIRERKDSVTVLLCGTSGCGKSTLSALLGSRLGITTVISTDSIRHMMRSFVDEKQNPLLWASTYHAGDYLDPIAVTEAKAKRRAIKSTGNVNSYGKELSESKKSGVHEDLSGTELISPKQMAVEGFKAQSEMVIDSLDRLITAWEDRKESVVVEGVHLSLNFVMGLMKKHPSIIPFMIYIASEDKHLERFAVRAKYMTLDPARNKYVKYIRNIRTIQDYLCKQADKHLVPKINNTNVDKSVAAIHATLFSCLRRRDAGDQLYDPITNTANLLEEEYRNQCAANSLSSKGMFQLIQRQGSSRHLMALVNTDGSVAKAWPVNSMDSSGNNSQGNENGTGTPMYGPLQIGKAEPVNLQFGYFGISAWPSDGGTSYSGSIDGSRVDGGETGSKYYSSCCSSPRMSDGPFKELKEENSVHESDDEVDDHSEADSDDDLSLSGNGCENLHDDVGSVDESTKSDEEYDDLAMADERNDGYWSDDEEYVPIGRDVPKVKDNIHKLLSQPLPFFPSFLVGTNEDVANHSNNKPRRRSLSIPAIGKYGSVIDERIISGAF